MKQTGTGFRVLVAEDEAINRLHIVSLLEARGFLCVSVGSGREAIKAFKKEQFDVVLLDIGLPGLDGLAVAKEIRDRGSKSGRRIPIAALTAHNSKRDRADAQDSGFDVFISKPFGERALVEAVEALARAGRDEAT